VKKELTAQQIFNKVAMHLAKQGKKAMSRTGFCRNYTEEGLRCAVGCLMPIRHYKRNKNDWGGSPYAVMGALAKYGVNYDKQSDLLNELQNVHDMDKVSRWGQKLRGLAKKQKLEIPEWLRLVK
jgi:hypothetical protein